MKSSQVAAGAKVFAFLLGIMAIIGLGPSAVLAKTQVEVNSPTDGIHQPGLPVPVVVSISSDRAVSGTLSLKFPDSPVAVSRHQVDVPGGSTRELMILAATPPWQPGSLQASFVTDDEDEDAEGRDTLALRSKFNAELVGLTPTLASLDPPDKAELTVEIGEARLFELDPRLFPLGVDGLALFSQIITTASDLNALAPSELATLEQWVTSQGGILVVDDAPGTPLPLNELSIEPGTDEAHMGLGLVRFTDGNAQAGRYDRLLKPSNNRMLEDGPFGFGFGGFPSIALLAADAGFKLPSIGLIVIMLAVYALIVGPVAWLILRRSHREPLLWLSVPVAAIVAVAGVWLAGRAIREGTTTSHTTMHVDLPGSRFSATQVLVSSPSGGRRGVNLAQGWGQSATQFDESMFFEEFGFEGGGRSSRTAVPFVDGDELVLDLPPGGLGVVSATANLEADEAAWAIDMAPTDKGLQGTVTNLTGHELKEVYVISGRGFKRINSIKPGDSAEVTLNRTHLPPLFDDDFSNRLFQSAEREAFGEGPFGRENQPNQGVVNPTLLVNWLSRNPQLRSPGFVTVVGWTRETSAPLVETNRDPIEVGRTAFVSVERLDSPAIAGSAGVELMRGFSTQVADQPIPNGCQEGGLTLRYTPPVDESWSTPVVALDTRMILAMDVWNKDEWQPVGLSDLDIGVRNIAIAAPDLGADGQLYIKIGLSCEVWGNPNMLPQLRDATDEDEVLAIGQLGQATGPTTSDPTQDEPSTNEVTDE